MSYKIIKENEKELVFETYPKVVAYGSIALLIIANLLHVLTTEKINYNAVICISSIFFFLFAIQSKIYVAFDRESNSVNYI